MGRRITFWITSEDLFSSQPSAIQATEATMNITTGNGYAGTHVCRDHRRSEDGRTGSKGSQYG